MWAKKGLHDIAEEEENAQKQQIAQCLGETEGQRRADPPKRLGEKGIDSSRIDGFHELRHVEGHLIEKIGKARAEQREGEFKELSNHEVVSCKDSSIVYCAGEIRKWILLTPGGGNAACAALTWAHRR